jgi:membrane protease YdiL (CAAX protease family)
MANAKKAVSNIQKMLNAWAIVLIIWSVYRSYFKTDLPIWFDEFIAKPIVFLVPVFYFINKYEKIAFYKAVDLFVNRKQDILFGIFAGLVVFAFGIAVYFQNTGRIFPEVNSSFFLLVSIAVGSSISEEILSRGFVLKRLYADSKNVYTSVFFASFLFFLTHIPILFTNPAMRGNVLLQVMVTDLLLSFGVSLAYLQRKNVMVPIIIHAFYNLAIYLLLS